MNADKQKILELLRKKEYWEKKKNWYFLQYHDWVDNGPLRMLALLPVLRMVSDFKKSSGWMKAIEWILFAITILLCLLFLYKMIKSWPYQEKVKVCERKIADIDCQIAKELGELELIEKNLTKTPLENKKNS